jgi:hypothetical protein
MSPAIFFPENLQLLNLNIRRLRFFAQIAQHLAFTDEFFVRHLGNALFKSFDGFGFTFETYASEHFPSSVPLRLHGRIATRHRVPERGLSRRVRTDLRKPDNPNGRPDAMEFGERVPATSDRQFAYTVDIGRFELPEFQNFPHECETARRLELVSWNPQGRERRIRRG